MSSTASSTSTTGLPDHTSLTGILGSATAPLLPRTPLSVTGSTARARQAIPLTRNPPSLLHTSTETAPLRVFEPFRIWRDFPNFDLAPNQALVITTNLAGAAYFGIPVQNIWTVTADYWDHQSSLTNAQALPNPGGTYTFVVSSRDPGVHNWVDTTGLQQGTMVIRWQGVPLGNVPSISGQVVDLSNLSSVLPAAAVFVTTSQRALQPAQREAGFERRVAPGVPGDVSSRLPR